MLLNVEIPVPSIEKQERISILLNEQLERIAFLKNTTDMAVSDTQFACDKLNREIVRNLLGECPRSTLGEIVQRIEAGRSIRTLERAPRENEFAVLKVSAMSWDHFDPAETKALPADYVPPQSHVIRKGDLLISRANTKELVGAAVMVEEDHPNLVLSDKSLRLILDTARVLPEFLLLTLRFPEARSFIEDNATGSSSSMRNVSQETIRCIPVPVPGLDVQRRVANTLYSIALTKQTLVESYKKQLGAISALPAAYLRRAFSGSI